MLTIALFAATLALDGGQAVTVIAPAAPPAQANPNGETQTRRVCRFERATGSNLQQRVCRDVPVGGNFQDQQTREFMRANQRTRLNDPAAGG
jgi:hypothetical protein